LPCPCADADQNQWPVCNWNHITVSQPSDITLPIKQMLFIYISF
jgi:hypothetical protein